jgi:hypothetical protein
MALSRRTSLLLHNVHRLPVILLVAAATALTATPAGAKGITGVSVCGADGCRAGHQDPATLAPLLDWGTEVADPGRAPFLRIKQHVGDGGQTFGITTVIYLPGLGLQRHEEEGVWTRPYPDAALLLKHLTHGIRPLPARQLLPHRPSGPPVPEAPNAPAVAAPTASAAPTGAGTADGGSTAAPTADGGSTGAIVAAGAAVALALALAALALLRRRRGGGSGRPAIG